jgi:hypothetical protein
MKKWCLVFVLTLIISVGFVSGQRVQIEGWNAQLVEYAEGRSSLNLAEIVDIAKQRESAMINLLESDVGMFSDLLLPESAIADLQQEVKDYLETPVVDLQERVSVFVLDSFTSEGGRFDYFLLEGGEMIYFAKYITNFNTLRSGDLVIISGVRIGDVVFVQQLEIIISEGGGAALPNSRGDRRIAVVLASFDDVRISLDPSLNDRGWPGYEDELIRALDRVVENFKRESCDQLRFTYDIFESSISGSIEDLDNHIGNGIWSKAFNINLINGFGYDHTQYDFFVIITPKDTFGKGGAGWNFALGPGALSVVQHFSGCVMSLAVSHEIGHNLGFNHDESEISSIMKSALSSITPQRFADFQRNRLWGACERAEPPICEDIIIDFPPPERGLIRGDANDDGVIDIADPVAILEFLFIGEREPLLCKDVYDANDDGVLDISDSVYLLNYLFTGTVNRIPPLFDSYGDDPTPDGLSCI